MCIKIMEHEDINRMTAENCAICLSPALMEGFFIFISFFLDIIFYIIIFYIIIFYIILYIILSPLNITPPGNRDELTLSANTDTIRSAMVTVLNDMEFFFDKKLLHFHETELNKLHPQGDSKTGFWRRGMTEEDYSILFCGAEVKYLNEGDVVLEKDEENDKIFRIESGSCEFRDVNGKIGIGTDMHVFGHSCALGRKRTTAKVSAICSTKLYYIRKEDLENAFLIDQNMSVKWYSTFCKDITMKIASTSAVKTRRSRSHSTIVRTFSDVNAQLSSPDMQRKAKLNGLWSKLSKHKRLSRLAITRNKVTGIRNIEMYFASGGIKKNQKKKKVTI